jgi:ubiquinone/menaquinone biosynthesis C-methylase UbiE
VDGGAEVVTIVTSAYDKAAASFERQRALPGDVAQSVRAAVLAAVGHVKTPRLLDLGAGSGRIGWSFVAAGDDYVAIDLSAAMLQVFAEKDAGGHRARLVQADGRALPFTASSFDAVLMIAVFGDVPDWRPLVAEACRVVRPHGVVVIGRTATPDDGIDEQMKERLDQLLAERMPHTPRKNGRKNASQHLATTAAATTNLVPACWSVERSPRQFLERHAGGARFSRLPLGVREEALAELAEWAKGQFGSLDARFTEAHRFEMQVCRFGKE